MFTPRNVAAGINILGWTAISWLKDFIDPCVAILCWIQITKFRGESLEQRPLKTHRIHGRYNTRVFNPDCGFAMQPFNTSILPRAATCVHLHFKTNLEFIFWLLVKDHSVFKVSVISEIPKALSDNLSVWFFQQSKTQLYSVEYGMNFFD